MQFRDKTAYVWGLRYRWDPSLSRNPVPQFPHFMPPWSELPLLEENLWKYEELVWKMCHSGRRIPLDRTMPRFKQNWINFHKFGQCFTFCDNWKWKYKKLKRKWGRIPRMATCRFSTKLNKFSQMWKLLGKGEISPQWKFFPKIFTNSGTEVEEEA